MEKQVREIEVELDQGGDAHAEELGKKMGQTKRDSSGNAQVYKVGGTTGIKEVQYSPSTVGAEKVKQSTHRGEYYKITYVNNSIAKVIDPYVYRPTFKEGAPIYDKDTIYYNSRGEKVIFNGSNNVWESK